MRNLAKMKRIKMLSFAKLCNQKKNFSRLSGVTLSDFLEIVRKVRPLWDKFVDSKKVSGRNSKIKSLEDEVLLVLVYYRFYVSFKFMEMLFNLNESNIYRHIQRLEPMLVKVMNITKKRDLTQSDLETIVIDATEIQIQRPTRKQRKFYSGKKKKHTQKVEIMVSQNGKIINVSKVFSGKTHDFKIRKESDKIPIGVEVLADSGYQGIHKLHKNSTLPHKRKRTQALTHEQKSHNKKLASKRIIVEHVFAQLKKFKILGSIYRNHKRKLHLRFNIISGMHNLKFS